MAHGLSCEPDSAARPFAEGLAWLWRLDLADSPAAGRVAVAEVGEPAARVRAAVASGEVAGAVLLGHEGTPAEGIADFDRLGRMHGTFSTLGSGVPVVTSSLGAHAAVESEVLRIAAGPDGDWGRLTSAWVLAAVAGFFEGTVGLRLRRLPPLGCIRLDDFPGTAEVQTRGEAHSDFRQSPLARRMRRAADKAGGVVNLAVPAQALRGTCPVPLDEIWPKAIAALRKGVEAGGFEAVCHGLLHLDPDELKKGNLEFREFAKLSADEAGRRIDAAVEWQTRALGAPRTFVAPAWGYSDGALQALAERSMPHWMPQRPGPLVDGEQVFETLVDGPPGLVGLDFRPVTALARLGLPPVVVLHGRMLDGRHLPPRPRALDAARLAVKRDIYRLPSVPGVSWVGAGALVDALREHDGIGPEAVPATEPSGSRPGRL